VSCLNCSGVSTFFALDRISRQTSLKTRSVHEVFASSISCLQAVNMVSFMWFGFSLVFEVFLGFLGWCFWG